MTAARTHSAARVSRVVCAIAALLVLAQPASARALSFDERVLAQEAIERVRQAHRIGATAAFERSVPRAALEDRVRHYLRRSLLLERLSGRPLAAADLEAEWQRISDASRLPGRLVEIYRALGRDAFLIQECFVRPVLVERELARLFSTDDLALPESRSAEIVPVAHDTFWPRQVASTCLPDDTWHATSQVGAPAARSRHTAVWNGNELIVWGGTSAAGELDTGARYDPVTDSWTPTALPGAPSPRSGHTAVWSHERMVVWGGGSFENTGARYDPLFDAWEPLTTIDAPEGRRLHTAVGSAGEMIVWGGVNAQGAKLNSGGRYDPVHDSWAATTTTGAPTARSGHTMVWTGTVAVVWGGEVGTASTQTGGFYDPAQNHWRPTTTIGAPLARRGHTAVWTGSRMVIWGGYFTPDDPLDLGSGGRYNPVADSWLPTQPPPTLGRRRGATSVWTGREVVIWGGQTGSTGPGLGTGERYDPVADTWAPLSIADAPSGRIAHTATWTGGTMIIWGGSPGDSTHLDSGGQYAVDQQADLDQDGYSYCDGDCDTGDPATYPGAPEIIDCRDNDCDGLLPPEEALDADGDGWIECIDNCPGDSNPTQQDTDRDGAGDVCDPCPLDPLNDDDHDGACGGADNCPGLPNADQHDADGDGVGDVCDNCPALWNYGQADFDHDGAGDVCDNCIVAFNPGQADSDRVPVPQWAIAASASSEYSSTDWSAEQATGAAQLAGCDSIETNWAPLTGGTDPEWIALTYAEPVTATGVRVYESGLGEPGFVRRIELVEPGGGPHTLWSASDPSACGETFLATGPPTPYAVEGVIVHTQGDEWEEIDAVELIGIGAPSPDGAGDVCDVCPLVPGPHQDADADGAGDDCDCAPHLFGARRPVEVGQIAWSAGASGWSLLTWPEATWAETYSITRVVLSELGPNRYGRCLASGLATMSYDDSEPLATGKGFGYLVQGVDSTCGAGSLGEIEPGAERVNLDPAACF